MIDRPTATGRSNNSLGLEGVLIGIIGILSILIGIIDFTGILETDFISKHIGDMTLVILGLIAIHGIAERRGSLRQLDADLQEIDAHLNTLISECGRMSAFLDGFNGDRFSELKLIYGVRGYVSRVSENEITVARDEVFNMWTDLLRESRSFLAFNYVSPDEVWGTKGWAFNIAQALQTARVQVGCSISRVFVVESRAELNRMKPLMKLQAAAGIDARWLLKSEVEAQAALTRCLTEIGTWDFVLVDGEMVYRVFLNDRRLMDRCSVTKSREIYQKANRAFSEAIKLSHDHSYP